MDYATEIESNFGRTIKLFLVNGNFSGLIKATVFGWTGIVYVCNSSSFGALLVQEEVDRTGIYVLFGPDPDNSQKNRVYIGSGNSVSKRIEESVKEEKNEFWEKVYTFTTSDDEISKGHAEYLEARIIDIARKAGNVTRSEKNTNPDPKKRALPLADRDEMERFIQYLKVIFPVVGLEVISQMYEEDSSLEEVSDVVLEVKFKKEEYANIFVKDGKFIVQKDALAAGGGYDNIKNDSYRELRKELIDNGILIRDHNSDGKMKFSKNYTFKSPSAAASVILNRTRGGQTACKVKGKDQSYKDWQQEKAKTKRK